MTRHRRRFRQETRDLFRGLAFVSVMLGSLVAYSIA
jgi:hypothetical protein